MNPAEVIAALATENLELRDYVKRLRTDLEDCKRQRDMMYAQLVLLQEKAE